MSSKNNRIMRESIECVRIAHQLAEVAGDWLVDARHRSSAPRRRPSNRNLTRKRNLTDVCKVPWTVRVDRCRRSHGLVVGHWLAGRIRQELVPCRAAGVVRFVDIEVRARRRQTDRFLDLKSKKVRLMNKIAQAESELAMVREEIREVQREMSEARAARPAAPPAGEGV